MGIDAQMFVRVPGIVSDDQVREWSFRLGAMAPEGALFLRSASDKPVHRPLERLTEYEQDGPTIYPSKNETFLSVALGGRYYGEGYERGSLLEYVALAAFLEVLIPGAEVWYGGDSSGVCAECFDAVRRQSLLQHAALNSRTPYCSRFGDHAQDGFQQPLCPTCVMPMWRKGMGEDYAAFGCEACDWEIVYDHGRKLEGFDVTTKRITAARQETER